MTRKNASFEILALIVGAAILASLGWKLSRQPADQAAKNNQNEPSTESGIKSQDETKDKKEPNGKILVQTVSAKNNTFSSIDLRSLQKKIYYTDSDEKKKIILPIGTAAGSLLFIEGESGQSESGDLVAVSKDGKAQKETLQSNVSTSLNPVLSPDGKSILVTEFSQAEREFGFSLILTDLKGGNRRMIMDKQSSLSNPVFSPDQNKILFSSFKDGKSELDIVSLDGKTVKSAKIDGTIIDLAWGEVGILISVAPPGNSTANLSKVNVLTEELVSKEIKSPGIEGAKIDLVPISPVLYSVRAINLPSGIISAGVEGKIYLVDVSSGETKEISQAQRLIGYYD